MTITVGPAARSPSHRDRHGGGHVHSDRDCRHSGHRHGAIGLVTHWPGTQAEPRAAYPGGGGGLDDPGPIASCGRRAAAPLLSRDLNFNSEPVESGQLDRHGDSELRPGELKPPRPARHCGTGSDYHARHRQSLWVTPLYDRHSLLPPWWSAASHV